MEEEKRGKEKKRKKTAGIAKERTNAERHRKCRGS